MRKHVHDLVGTDTAETGEPIVFLIPRSTARSSASNATTPTCAARARALEPATGMCQVEAAREQLAVHDTASGAIRILICEHQPKGNRLAEKGDYGDKYSGATLPPDPRAGGIRAAPGRHRH
jgi:hypothetical protein